MRHETQSCRKHCKCELHCTRHCGASHQQRCDAATPQIANSVRYFDSRFQPPQESRVSQRDNTHFSMSFTTNPPCQLPSNQLQILVDELFIAAIAIHLVAPNGNPLTLYKPTCADCDDRSPCFNVRSALTAHGRDK